MSNNATLPSNATTNCFYPQHVIVEYILGTQVSTFRFITAAFVFLKIAFNWHSFVVKKIFLVYFIFLFVGNILIGSGDIIVAYNAHMGVNNISVSRNVNICAILGILCIDTFFGLVPNLFYSIYKTKLTLQANVITDRFFTANFLIIGCLFVVIITFNFAAPTSLTYWMDLIIILEIVYTMSFYIIVIVSLRQLYRIQRVLVRFFCYYVVYAIFQVVRCSMVATYLSPANQSNPNPTVTWNEAIADNLTNGFLTVAILLFLRDLKFKPAEKSSSSNSSTPAPASLDAVKSIDRT